MREKMAVCISVLMVAVAWSTGGAEAGCASSSLCCRQHNNTCVANGPRLKSPTSETCYCDEYCLNTGDCCTDFSSVCRPVDCRLGDWNDWEDCNTQCGRGVMTRKRRVIVDARNGGKPCGSVSERRLCWGTNCKVARSTNGGNVEEQRETGKIIPSVYGSWRSNKMYDPFKDPLRSNLYEEYHKHNLVTRPMYHTMYEVVRSSPICGAKFAPQWARALKKGASICVECQQFAMHKRLGVRCKGHGALQKETRWDAVITPGCHGIWTMKSAANNGPCPASKEQAFIFI